MSGIIEYFKKQTYEERFFMGKKILIADDDVDIVRLMQLRLEKSGYSVLAANSGLQAMEIARKEKPDLILLDINMPPPNGFQVCRELREDPDFRDTPIIFLTGKTTDSDKFWGKEAGANEYITKPYEGEELLQKIKKLLGES